MTPPSSRSKAANGDGSIRKDRQGRWIVELSLGTGPDGRRRRTRRVAPSYAEAKTLCRELSAARDKGVLTQISTATVATYGLSWIKDVKTGHVLASTASDYEARLRRDITPYLGTIRLLDLTPRHVEQWMANLRALGKSVRTVNGARRILFQMCKHAQRTGLVATNVVAATDPLKAAPNARTQVRTPWSKQEAAAALHAAIHDDRVDCFLHLMLHTGMRPGEALGLLWADVHLDEGYLDVTGTLKEARFLLSDGSGVVRLIRNPPKTAASRRRLPISEALHAALLRQQMRQDIAALALGVHWEPSGHVLTSNRGTPVSPSNNRRFVSLCLRQAGIRYIRMHDLRHTVALLSLNDADIPIEKASQALGHTRIDTTKQVYAGNVPKYNGDFIRGIAGALPHAPRAAQHRLLPSDRDREGG